MKITSPAVGYTAKDQYGAVVLDFQDGVAEFKGTLPVGVRQYLVGAGYGLGGDEPVVPELVIPPDPRDVTVDQVGTPLRDAAVDPHQEDFLPPVNAGEPGDLGNPHGPYSVAPGIHGVGPGPIVPGLVGEPDYQQAKESAAAEAVLVDQEDATDVAEALGEIADREREKAQTDTEPDEDSEIPVDEVDNIVQEELEEADAEPEPDVELKGQALEEALEERGLAKTGTADEKRARVAEHDAAAKSDPGQA